MKFYDECVCGPSNMFECPNGDWVKREDHVESVCRYSSLVQVADEEFAQFVFYHFGNLWMLHQNKRALYPNEAQTMTSLPKRVADRVTQLAREYELKRGGP